MTLLAWRHANSTLNYGSDIAYWSIEVGHLGLDAALDGNSLCREYIARQLTKFWYRASVFPNSLKVWSSLRLLC